MLDETLFVYFQEVKALREETSQEENRYHYINSMTAVSKTRELRRKKAKGAADVSLILLKQRLEPPALQQQWTYTPVNLMPPSVFLTDR